MYDGQTCSDATHFRCCHNNPWTEGGASAASVQCGDPLTRIGRRSLARRSEEEEEEEKCRLGKNLQIRFLSLSLSVKLKMLLLMRRMTVPPTATRSSELTGGASKSYPWGGPSFRTLESALISQLNLRLESSMLFIFRLIIDQWSLHFLCFITPSPFSFGWPASHPCTS